MNGETVNLHAPKSQGALRSLPTLEDLPPVSGHRVLVRADLNVPLRAKADGGFEVADDFRIRSSVPTLEWLVGNGALVSVCSHLGRPKGSGPPLLHGSCARGDGIARARCRSHGEPAFRSR